MKELSIEEKAEAYDEAIEKGKQIQNTPYTAHWDIMKEVVEHLLPELKESEDEKVRKEIVTYLKSIISNKGYRDEIIESWIAWLEKQGEHANFRNKIQIGDKVTRNEDGVLVNLSQLKRVAKPAEEYNITGISSKNAQGKLGEMIKNLKPVSEVLKQNPAWSEEDERLCSCLIKEQEKSLDNVKNDKYGHSEIILDLKEMYRERIDWLKSIKERLQLQPKQEWSEEDNRHIKWCIEWLGSAKMINNTPLDVENIKEQISWLKSLKGRYTWKPSDEQMKALHDLNITGNISYVGQGQVLIELQEQLKKLREE